MIQFLHIFVVDFLNNFLHGLGTACIFAGEENTVAGTDDQSNQADDYNGNNDNPSTGGNSGDQGFRAGNSCFDAGYKKFAGSFYCCCCSLSQLFGGHSGDLCGTISGVGSFLCCFYRF